MNRKIAFALLLIGSAGVAHADAELDSSLPKFDVEKHCARALQGTWSLTRTRAGCLHAEKQAYDQLKTSWMDLPMETRVFCGKVSRTVDNSYATLQECVTTESGSDNFEAHLRAMAQQSSAFRQPPPKR